MLRKDMWDEVKKNYIGHYKLTVMENMCAKFLDKKGGAKRMQWNSLFPPETVEQHEMTDSTNLLGPKSSMDPLSANDKVAGLLPDLVVIVLDIW